MYFLVLFFRVDGRRRDFFSGRLKVCSRSNMIFRFLTFVFSYFPSLKGRQTSQSNCKKR